MGKINIIYDTINDVCVCCDLEKNTVTMGEKEITDPDVKKVIIPLMQERQRCRIISVENTDLVFSW